MPLIVVNMLHMILLRQNVEDTWVWTHSNSGAFSVRLAYQAISSASYTSTLNSDFSIWKHIWTFKLCLLKVRLFSWRLVVNSLPVSSRMARFVTGINLVCSLCLNADESSISFWSVRLVLEFGSSYKSRICWQIYYLKIQFEKHGIIVLLVFRVAVTNHFFFLVYGIYGLQEMLWYFVMNT